MAEVSNTYNDYVEYWLKSDGRTPLKIEEPIGWQEDDFELDRHQTYHGVFSKFTNNLKFVGDGKDFIETVFELDGINAKIILEKKKLKDVDGDIKMVTHYTSIADLSTRKIKNRELSVKFNSNDLADIMKSHESDEFEIERIDDINGNLLTPLTLEKVNLTGREILQTAESHEADEIETVSTGWNAYKYTPKTKVITEGMDRHEAVVNSNASNSSQRDYEDYTASNMFWIPDPFLTDENGRLTVSYEADVEIIEVKNSSAIFTGRMPRVEWDEGSLYPEQAVHLLTTDTGFKGTLYANDLSAGQIIKYRGSWTTDYNDKTGLLFMFSSANVVFRISRIRLRLSEVTIGDETNSLDFLMYHDVIKRLMYIITGQNTSFYSKYFGRTGTPEGYAEKGFGGHIGLIWGLWARAFPNDVDEYKSLTTSLKDAISSAISVFNVGIGIERVNFRERLRIEDKKFFYQPEVIVKLPFQVQKVERTTLGKDFVSGMTFGYNKGGDYEDSMGLDEPNGETNTITPIRRSSNKYLVKSKIQADDYGLELARRKDWETTPREDTQYDDRIWWLDLKQDADGVSFTQNEWMDRLVVEPTGIFSPETFKGMLFTPLRMLMRHAWTFKVGMTQYIDDKIKYISSKSKVTLSQQFIGEDKAYAENDDIVLRDLERPRLLPEEIKFTHPVDDDLLEWIQGTTTLEVNGQFEEVPNVYFKFEWLNEHEQLERGYLKNLKPKKEGVFTMIKSNEKLIKPI